MNDLTIKLTRIANRAVRKAEGLFFRWILTDINKY